MSKTKNVGNTQISKDVKRMLTQTGKGQDMAKRNKKSVSLPKMIGDHGPETAAQMKGAEIVLLEGDNPNRVGRKRRVNVLGRMHKSGSLSLRQYQAGNEIQEAYCQCEALSSGGPISERVQSTPDPDRYVCDQVDAQSRLKCAMAGVPSAMRYVVEHVCWNNKPLSDITKGRMHGMHSANLKVALDLVANRLRRHAIIIATFNRGCVV